MKSATMPVLVVLLLFCSVVGFAESIDEMDARLERDRVKIEAERKSFNEDCRHVRHEDAAAVSACSSRQAIILFEMEHWKFEIARAHEICCTALGEGLARWTMGVARAQDVMARNLAMMKRAQEEHLTSAGELAQSTAKFAVSFYLDNAAENLTQATVTKQSIDRVLDGGPVPLSGNHRTERRNSSGHIGELFTPLQHADSVYEGSQS
jgi:hypothetical protein